MSLYTGGGYLERNPTWHEEHSGWKARQISRILTDNGVQPRSIAEVGCGSGGILTELAELMPDVAALTGFEISPQAFERCVQRTTGRVTYQQRDVLADPPETLYDLVMAIDVFEHVDDYIGFIRQLDRVGRRKLFHIPLELSVSSMLRPQVLQRARDGVGHLHYFTRETALATLRQAQLKILDERFTSLAIDAPAGLKTGLARLPRMAMRALSPSLAARVLGGFSLLVLAE